VRSVQTVAGSKPEGPCRFSGSYATTERDRRPWCTWQGDVDRRTWLASSLVAALAVTLAVGCGGGGHKRSVAESETGNTLIYFLAGYFAPGGYRGQLEPVPRHLRTARTVVAALLRGPSRAERRDGLISTLPTGTRLRRITLSRATATVYLVGEDPELDGSAAIVYSLTELPGIRGVRFRLDGKPCCFYQRAIPTRPIARPMTRRDLRYWMGEPCQLRTRPDQVRCRWPRGRLASGRLERPTLEGNIKATNNMRAASVSLVRCRGEGRIIDGSRFYECRISWRGGFSARYCVGAQPTGEYAAYLPSRRCSL
jgi:sporulation and spore germination protein